MDVKKDNTLSKVSILNRMTIQDLKRTLSLVRLVTIIDCINSVDEDDNSIVEIPFFGKIVITKELDFEFIPDNSLRKDIFEIKKNPDSFLKTELKKLLKIED